ncbi:hypothetical protein [Tolypothrix sp. NIES-4075]|nr:hypothetical protein [Tolypothrix sp. NIES-4075]
MSDRPISPKTEINNFTRALAKQLLLAIALIPVLWKTGDRILHQGNF